MKKLLEKFQVSLFPSVPFFPEANNWQKVAGKIIEKFDCFAGDGDKALTLPEQQFAYEIPRIIISSEKEEKEVQLSPSKFSFREETKGERVKDYTKEFFEFALNLVPKWSRIGYIYSFFVAKESVNEVVMRNIFKSFEESWQNMEVRLTCRDYSPLGMEINQVVAISAGTIETENKTIEGYVLSIDVNNVPSVGKEYDNTEIGKMYKQFSETATYKKIFNILGISEDERPNSN